MIALLDAQSSNPVDSVIAEPGLQRANSPDSEHLHPYPAGPRNWHRFPSKDKNCLSPSSHFPRTGRKSPEKPPPTYSYFPSLPEGQRLKLSTAIPKLAQAEPDRKSSVWIMTDTYYHLFCTRHWAESVKHCSEVTVLYPFFSQGNRNQKTKQRVPRWLH